MARLAYEMGHRHVHPNSPGLRQTPAGTNERVRRVTEGSLMRTQARTAVAVFGGAAMLVVTVGCAGGNKAPSSTTTTTTTTTGTTSGVAPSTAPDTGSPTGSGGPGGGGGTVPGGPTGGGGPGGGGGCIGNICGGN
nr:hypothetical protein MFLOJ_05080 [Mycobacterium florentinum]